MSDRPDLSYEQFVAFLRSALHYLYDPVHLRRSQLVEILGLHNEFDRAAALQHSLVAAIRALKPGDDEPPQSRAWRTYDTLSLQYVRQLAREVVATQLGISERQMRREQRLAIEALAQHLWQSVQQPGLAGPGTAEAPVNAFPVRTNHASIVAPERFRDEPPAEAKAMSAAKAMPEVRIPLGEALENVRSLAFPLAQQMNVPLEIYITDGLVELPVPPMALRTLLLTVLTIAIPLAGAGSVVMTAARHGEEIAVTVTCSEAGAEREPLAGAELARLITVQEQAAFYNARLQINGSPPGRLAVTLFLPAPEQAVVLVVDDNTDWLELVQRYAAGSRYQIVPTNSPATACDNAGKLQPSLIVLDVMMQNVDGWQILSELRYDPATSHIPVIVCTILPLEEMALALGASGFLQKPVSQQQFLHALGRQGSP